MLKDCLNCGMQLDASMNYCPKCDNDLESQHDGSTVTIDIAHNGERLREAIDKMAREIECSKNLSAENLRLIVGTGMIRDEVLIRLRDFEFRGDIKGFQLELPNRGSVKVRLK
ncbi:MAG: hypothetical protein AB8B95_13650 [Pseudohongiellaceae bacterium]